MVICCATPILCEKKNPVIKEMYSCDLQYILLSDVQFWDLKGQQLETFSPC